MASEHWVDGFSRTLARSTSRKDFLKLVGTAVLGLFVADAQPVQARKGGEICEGTEKDIFCCQCTGHPNACLETAKGLDNREKLCKDANRGYNAKKSGKGTCGDRGLCQLKKKKPVTCSPCETCVEGACVARSCGPCQRCDSRSGACRSACSTGQVCRNGQCVIETTCNRGGNCSSDIVRCGDGCFCHRSVEGSAVCTNPFACDKSIACVSSADCVERFGEGFYCQEHLSSCCGSQVCAPPCGKKL